MNEITDAPILDGLTGNAAFNAVPVRVEAAASAPGPERVAGDVAGRIAALSLPATAWKPDGSLSRRNRALRRPAAEPEGLDVWRKQRLVRS
jgi:hypothetical protein